VTALNFPNVMAGPFELISSAQNLTAVWADLGSELAVAGAKSLGLWMNLDINDSSDVRVRLLAKHTGAGTEEHVLPIKVVSASSIALEDEYFEFTDDADQSMILFWDLEGLVPYVQFQVIAGTLGAGAGQVDTALVTSAK
jgi:hypothetical protein